MHMRSERLFSEGGPFEAGTVHLKLMVPWGRWWKTASFSETALVQALPLGQFTLLSNTLVSSRESWGFANVSLLQI